MRRLGLVGLDAFEFHAFEDLGLTLDLFFQQVHSPALLDEHTVQLLHLVFQMREVRLDRFQSLPGFVVHKFGQDFKQIPLNEQES